jgi:c-di-GMP-related signal transduction protein
MAECIARQPIFDTKLRIYGYELLYRSDKGAGLMPLNIFAPCDPDKATSSVLANSMFLFGIDKLTHGKLAFVNFSRRMLISDVMTFLPYQDIAIEVLETVEPDALSLAACEKLKAAGYKIVLDDFVYSPQMEPLIAVADIIKIDFVASSLSYCEAIPKQFRQRKDLVFLAEKVETHDQYLQAVAWGYTLFQGYFFCKPLVLDTQDIQGNKVIYFKLLKELNDPEVGLKRLESIIQRDVSLSYKILKYINSVAFGLREKISSIQHAVAMIGKKKLSKFVTLVLLKGLGEDKPNELIATSIIRGRFAELIAEAIGLNGQAGDAFLAGMFSLMDALLDRPMNKILAELPLTDGISGALQRQPSKLTSILETVIAYEQGNWDKYDIYRQTIMLDNETARKLYLEAVLWAWNIEQ